MFTLWHADTPVRYVHGLISLLTLGENGFRRTLYPGIGRGVRSAKYRQVEQYSHPYWYIYAQTT